MTIHERHGRKGKALEYYEFTVKIPRFVAQRQGNQNDTDYWLVCRCDPNGGWRIIASGLSEHEARLQAYRELHEWLINHTTAWLNERGAQIP